MTGACMGAPLDCSTLTDMCNVGVCDATTGACVAMPMADGTGCDDGSLCTTTDVCTLGACAGTAVDCSGMSDMCNVGTCDATTGACGRVPVADGTSCDDADMCTGGDVCTAGACGGMSTATGDACGDAIDLPSTDGVHTVTGSISTCYTNDSNALGCSARGAGRDAVYRLVLPAARTVRFETAAPASGGYDTVLHLRRDCADRTSEVACDDDSGAGLYSLVNTYLEAGTYFLYVDAYGATATGSFDLTVDISSPDTCASPAPIAVPARGSITRVTGSTVGATNDYTGTCGGGSGPDQVFSINVTTRSRLRIETITPTTGAFDTLLYVRGTPCATGTELACNDDGGAGTRSRIDRVFDPGTYYIVVDAFGSGSGNFILEVESMMGHAVLLGHDFYEREANADRALGNAVFVSNNRSPELALRIVDYRQYADLSGTGEVVNTQAAIADRATALSRTTAYTNLADYTALNLADADVLLVYEQELTSQAQLQTVATAWNTQLNNFIRDGGVIVVLDHLGGGGGTWEIVDGTGLFTIPSSRSATGSAVTVTTATDPIAAGVTSGYSALNGSLAFPGSTGGTVVLSEGADALCRHLVR
jgi:hypothetical protein